MQEGENLEEFVDIWWIICEWFGYKFFQVQIPSFLLTELFDSITNSTRQASIVSGGKTRSPAATMILGAAVLHDTIQIVFFVLATFVEKP
jgi:hypothetical protein